MKIIISPAKKMHSQIDYMEAKTRPLFTKESRQLVNYMRTLEVDALMQCLRCSFSIAQWTKQAYQVMDLQALGVPALLAYDGIQYQYMKPDLFTDEAFSYAQKHVCILSALYGVLRALDGIMPYRLELDTALHAPFARSLYAYWGDKVSTWLMSQDTLFLNLASRQYAKLILQDERIRPHVVTCYFYEREHEHLREKGVYVKMARGAMVRYLAHHGIHDVNGVKHFCELGYHFDAHRSNAHTLIFVRDHKAYQRKKALEIM